MSGRLLNFLDAFLKICLVALVARLICFTLRISASYGHQTSGQELSRNAVHNNDFGTHTKVKLLMAVSEDQTQHIHIHCLFIKNILQALVGFNNLNMHVSDVPSKLLAMLRCSIAHVKLVPLIGAGKPG